VFCCSVVTYLSDRLGGRAHAAAQREREKERERKKKRKKERNREKEREREREREMQQQQLASEEMGFLPADEKLFLTTLPYAPNIIQGECKVLTWFIF
jgi:hypothetical protein